MKPTAETASTVSSAAAALLRRLARGTPTNTAPNAINPPVHGNLGACFIAELDAVIVRFAVVLPLADNVAVPLDGLTVMSEEFALAVHDMLSANVVEARVTATDCETPLLSGTEAVDGVIA